MTKFSTAVARVLLVLLVSAGAKAQSCFDLFGKPDLTDLGHQTAFKSSNMSETPDAYRVKLTQNPYVEPRLRELLSNLNTYLTISYERAIKREDGTDFGGLIPYARSATLMVPTDALESDAALASYLEKQIPLAREAAHKWAIEQNTFEVRTITREAKRIVTNWFQKNLVYVHLKTLNDNLGESKRNHLYVDKAYARYARSIGTFVHEIYHTTVTAKLTPQSTTTEVARAVYFNLKNAKVPDSYKTGFRADEFEARLKQIAILKLHKLDADARFIEQDLKLFQAEEMATCELFNQLLDQARFSEGIDADTKMPQIIVDLDGDRLYVPLVKPTDDKKAYVKAVLKKRIQNLIPRMKTPR